MSLQPQLSTRLRVIAERLDEPELHKLWIEVWLLEDRKSAQKYIDSQCDQRIRLYLQVNPVVIASELAKQHGISTARVGKLLMELRYTQQFLYVDGAQRRCWVRVGTQYPKLELHNYINRR